MIETTLTESKLHLRRPLSEARKRYIHELVDFIRPTHFITLSLNQSRSVCSSNGMKSWIRGDDICYGETQHSFIRTISKQIASKSAWKRNKQILRSAGTIEGDGIGTLHHLHILIAFPQNSDEFTIKQILCKAADGNAWFKSGNYRIDIQRVFDAEGVASYCTKHGIERLNYT